MLPANGKTIRATSTKAKTLRFIYSPAHARSPSTPSVLGTRHYRISKSDPASEELVRKRISLPPTNPIFCPSESMFSRLRSRLNLAQSRSTERDNSDSRSSGGGTGIRTQISGYLPPSVHLADARSRFAKGRCSSWSSKPSDYPLVVIPVQLEPAVLPGYTIPPRE